MSIASETEALLTQCQQGVEGSLEGESGVEDGRLTSPRLAANYKVPAHIPAIAAAAAASAAIRGFSLHALSFPEKFHLFNKTNPI